MMSSNAMYHCKNFKQLSLLLTTVDFYFAQSSMLFLYRQNKLESIKTVNVPNVTTCFMVSCFQILMIIICPKGTLHCIHIRNVCFFPAYGCSFINRHWLESCSFQTCKICAVNQSTALVLIAKYNMILHYFSKMYFILWYI